MVCKWALWFKYGCTTIENDPHGRSRSETTRDIIKETSCTILDDRQLRVYDTAEITDTYMTVRIIF